MLRQTGTRVVDCPSLVLKLVSAIARIDAYLAQGIALALEVDSASCNASLAPFAEMRLLATLHRVRGGPWAVPAVRALDIATRGGARALGLIRTGLLVPGYNADIVLLDLSRPPRGCRRACAPRLARPPRCLPTAVRTAPGPRRPATHLP